MAKRDEDEKDSGISESVEGAPGSPLESTSSDVATEDTAEQQYERKKHREEKERVRSINSGMGTSGTQQPDTYAAVDTPRQKPHNTDESEMSKIAHDINWSPMKGTTPKPENPNMRPNPNQQPFQPAPFGQDASDWEPARKKESFFHRSKEKLEELGYAATKKYDEVRKKPAEQAAQFSYDSRMADNEDKFKAGKISSAIYERRKLEYASAFEQEKKPIEKRVVDTSIHVGNAMYKGLQHTQQKVSADYKETPAPKIKPSQGLVWSKAGKIGVTPMRTATRKGKQVGAASPARINFGNTSFGNTGGLGTGSGGGVDFSGGLFGGSKPKKKKGK